MRRVSVVMLLALVFAAPAFGADIYVTNNSSLTEAQVADALPVYQRAVDEDFAPIWPKARGSKLILADAPSGAWEIRIVDDISECWFCSGYHAVENGVPFAVVSAKEGWQITFSHELWEILVNPYLDRVATVKWKKRKRLYALETADPVESSKFAYARQSPTGEPVQISDFVTPAWFRRGSAGPWDFTGGTDRALHVLEDGYQLWLKPNGFWGALYASAEAKEDGGAKAQRWNARHKPTCRQPHCPSRAAPHAARAQ